MHDRGPVWAIYTDDGLDQIVDSLAEAKREVRDLKAMGCGGARHKKFNSESEVGE